MKYVLILVVIILSGCATSLETERVEYSYDGEGCSPIWRETYIVSKPMQLTEIEKKLAKLAISSNEELEHLKSLKMEFGGELYELDTSKQAWNELRGAWGFGLVRQNCVFHFYEVIVS